MSNYVDLATATNELRRDLAEYAKIDGATERLARIIRNATLLAEEHPDDDDRPITAEWIDLYRISDVLYLIEKKDDLCLYVQVNGIYAEIEQYGDSVRIPISTRGDLRRLCKVLKIELKGKHGTSD